MVRPSAGLDGDGRQLNLASRLEGITKESRPHRNQRRDLPANRRQIVCRDLDKIRVKGKHQPVTIYELLDFAENKQKYEPMLSRYNHAMERTRAELAGSRQPAGKC